MRAAWGVLFLSLVVNTKYLYGPNDRASYKAQCTTRPGVLFRAPRSKSATSNRARCELLLRMTRAAIANPCCLPESTSCALRWRAFSRLVLKGIKLTIGQDAVLDVKTGNHRWR